uniref:Uncharacterized protein n=1 Tax=Lepeophtheirus salmonis TaxID=72036 RepID=A0A0K2VJS1_LEPSM
MANCISRELEDVLYKAFLSGLLDRKVARQTRFDLEKHPEMTAVEVMNMSVKMENAIRSDDIAYQRRQGVGARDLLIAMKEVNSHQRKAR